MMTPNVIIMYFDLGYYFLDKWDQWGLLKFHRAAMRSI